MKCSCSHALSFLSLLKVYGVIVMVVVQLPGSELVSQALGFRNYDSPVNIDVVQSPVNIDVVQYHSSGRIISQPCPFNKYVITHENDTQTCLRCTVCPKGFQTQTRCSYYNDTVCESCSSGWYSDVRGSSCQPCSGCDAGKYLHRYCTSKRNTTCRRCPSYTYTTKSNATVCIPCSRCKQNQKMVSKCDGIKDTTCGDCENDHFRLSSSGSCLPCSTCPPTLQYLVVPECRDKRGIYHPDICWPRYAHGQVITLEEAFDMLQTNDITPPIATSRKEEEEQAIRMRNIFIVAVLGSAVCCSILITIVFMCLHLPKCDKIASKSRFSRQPIVENNEDVIYASTNSNINHGSDIDINLEKARENAHVKENMSLKSAESFINRDSGYPKVSVRSDTRSEMNVVNTIITNANQFKKKKKTIEQEDTFDPFDCNPQYYSTIYFTV